MKTLYKDKRCKLVDNEQDYDFVGWVENFTTKTMILVFVPGDYQFDEDSEEVVYDESGWEVEDVLFCNESELEKKRQDFEDYLAYPDYTTMVEIEPLGWGGFAADNGGRSMFNALKEHLSN